MFVCKNPLLQSHTLFCSCPTVLFLLFVSHLLHHPLLCSCPTSCTTLSSVRVTPTAPPSPLIMSHLLHHPLLCSCPPAPPSPLHMSQLLHHPLPCSFTTYCTTLSSAHIPLPATFAPCPALSPTVTPTPRLLAIVSPHTTILPHSHPLPHPLY